MCESFRSCLDDRSRKFNGFLMYASDVGDVAAIVDAITLQSKSIVHDMKF